MSRYAVRSVFSTLQGEGARAGTRAVFVRLAGCNAWNGRPADRHLGKGACAAWCDTDFFKGESLSVAEIAAKMDAVWPLSGKPRWCVITGGEPLLQLDPELIAGLHSRGWKIAVETNGSLDVEAVREVDWITVSPKRGLPCLIREAHELKVVLPGGGGELSGWSDQELAELAANGRYQYQFVQPQDPINPVAVESSYLHSLSGESSPLRNLESAYAANLKRCIDFVTTNPDWRLGVQIHKYVQLP